MSKPESPTVRFPPGEVPQLTHGVQLGQVIAGDYRIERELGRGGMGVVFAAYQERLERLVAIKLIRGESAEDPRAVERLLREAKAAGRIQSEHVARVLDVGTLDSGAPFIVMEYLEGQDLDTLLRSGPLTITLAVDYLLQACEAVGEAHRNGIVHRDLKPANVFIAQHPAGAASVKVLDFGISKVIGGAAQETLTDQARPIGSLHHMAPEQLRGKPVDARTDIWALGVLLFEMLTGQKPFNGNTWPDVCAQVLNDTGPGLDTTRLELPEDLSAILRRCLSRNAAERFPNVAELAVALTPYGTNRARLSLERIVRLATSTGSLAAATLPSPPPPPAAPLRSAPPAESHGDTLVVPSDELSTKEAVITTVIPRPTRPFLVGAGVGVAFASVLGGLLYFAVRPVQDEQARAVQSLGALAPAAPAASAASTAVAATATAVAATPKVSVVAPEALPTLAVGESEPKVPVELSAPAGISGAAASDLAGHDLAGHHARVEPTGLAVPASHAAPDAGLDAREPATTTATTAPGAAPNTRGNPFDLSDIGFKPRERIKK